MRPRELPLRGVETPEGRVELDRLGRALALSDRFHLCLLVVKNFDAGHVALSGLRARLDAQDPPRALDEILAVDTHVSDRQTLTRFLLDRLSDAPAKDGRRPVFVMDAARTTAVSTQRWEEAFRSLNQMRDLIIEKLPGDLVFILTEERETLFIGAAPDLWSIRSEVAQPKIEIHPDPGDKRVIDPIEMAMKVMRPPEWAIDDIDLSEDQVRALREQVEETPDDPKRVSQYVEQSIALARKYIRENRQEEARSLLEEGVAHAGHLAQRAPEFSLFFVTKAQQAIIEILNLGNVQKAQSFARSTLEIIGSVEDKLQDPQALGFLRLAKVGLAIIIGDFHATRNILDNLEHTIKDENIQKLILSWRLIAHRLSGETDKALAALTYAKERDQLGALDNSIIAQVFSAAGDQAKAIEFLEKALNALPERPDTNIVLRRIKLLIDLGYHLTKAGRLDDACSAYSNAAQQAHESNGDDGTVFVGGLFAQLSWILARIGHVPGEELPDDFTKLIQKNIPHTELEAEIHVMDDLLERLQTTPAIALGKIGMTREIYVEIMQLLPQLTKTWPTKVQIPDHKLESR